MIRIGTRDSKLALWQAYLVQSMLLRHGFTSELVPLKSEGDIDLVTPLYAMGVQGVFTRSLDAALLNNKVDIAVHSMKDVPTQLAEGLIQGAVLPRGNAADILVYKDDYSPSIQKAVIATSSIRRRAQWLYRYPNTDFEILRGNMQTRLEKLATSNWHGAIFAKAGLERINILSDKHMVLDWMVPAPAQGAIVVVCRKNDKDSLQQIQKLNDNHAALCTTAERIFLSQLMGGCATPISAHAFIQNNQMHFKGNVTHPEGTSSITITAAYEPGEFDVAGYKAAEAIIQKGALALLKNLKT